MISVEVERPVKLHINGEKIKLTGAEARELVDKLCRALNYFPTNWWYTYPSYTYTTSGYSEEKITTGSNIEVETI